MSVYDRGRSGFPGNPRNYSDGSQNFGRLDEAYSMNGTLVGRPDFRNPKALLHDNLEENILDSHKSEYLIYIDGTDRDVVQYPNPFQFTVICNPIGERVEILSNGSTLRIKGDPDPVLQMKFQNVLTFEIETVILPKTNVIDTTTYLMSTESSDQFESKFRYVILKIPEVISNKIQTTGSKIDQSSFLLVNYNDTTTTTQTWIPTFKHKKFGKFNAINISRMSLRLYDEFGNLLTPIDTDGNMINLQTTLTTIKADADANPGDQAKQTLYKNLLTTISNMQMVYSIKIVTIENELNKFQFSDK